MYAETKSGFTVRLFKTTSDITTTLFKTKIVLHSTENNSTAFASLKAINSYGMRLSIYNNKKPITDHLVVEIPNSNTNLTFTARAEVVEKYQIDCNTIIILKFISISQLNQRKITALMDALHAS